MGGSTKLFQRAGSPLIQGHSRYARSFWVDWWIACLIDVLSICMADAVLTIFRTGELPFDSAASVSSWLAPALIPAVAAVATSTILVLLGRRLGSSRAWLWSAILGSVCGIGVLLFLNV